MTQAFGSYPPPRQKRGYKGLIIGLAVLLVLCCGGGAVLFGLGLKGAADSDRKMDVEITSCKFAGDEVNLPTATVEFTVKNNGKTDNSVKLSWDYRNAKGEQVDTDTTFTPTVKPGDTIKHSETTLLNTKMGTGGRCILTKVG